MPIAPNSFHPCFLDWHKAFSCWHKNQLSPLPRHSDQFFQLKFLPIFIFILPATIPNLWMNHTIFYFLMTLVDDVFLLYLYFNWNLYIYTKPSFWQFWLIAFSDSDMCFRFMLMGSKDLLLFLDLFVLLSSVMFLPILSSSLLKINFRYPPSPWRNMNWMVLTVIKNSWD